MRLGFDSYSLRDHNWKAIQLIEYAGSLKVDAVQLSSLEDFESLDPAYLCKVRNTADRLRIAVDVGIGCICPTSRRWNAHWGSPQQYIARGLAVAQALHSSCLRCFLGSYLDRPGPIEKHMESTIEVLRSVRSQVSDSGMKIALENHAGDMQGREVRTIIEEAGTDICGCCLDTGNPLWAMEDPFVTLETLKPYVLTSHFRDSVVFPHPLGAAFQWVPLGDGCIHFSEFARLFKEYCSQASVHLEIITWRAPIIVPWRDRDYWKLFPNTPAWEFARFVELAERGAPYLGDGVLAPPPEQQSEAMKAAVREQQIRDLERSVSYARNTLEL